MALSAPALRAGPKREFYEHDDEGEAEKEYETRMQDRGYALRDRRLHQCGPGDDVRRPVLQKYCERSAQFCFDRRGREVGDC